MRKSNGIIRLIGFFAVLGFVIFAAVFGLGKDKSGSIYDIKRGLDLEGGVSITYQAVEESPSADAMSDTKYKLQKRVENYSTEAEVYLEGSNRITIDIPGAKDANAILEELGKPGTLIFCTDAKDPEGSKVMDGNHIKNAQGAIQQDPTTKKNNYVVSLTLTSEGQKIFSEVTGELAKENDILYIVYDGEVVSSPRVNTQITGDQCEITGMTDLEEANELASTIRIGALPVELKELRSNVVGAKLGARAVETSLLAGAIGFGIVFLFMLVFYRIPGLAANLALSLYVGLIILVLSAFQVTLTLPGIAGIILGIGMAVDANVIIFARIREEIGAGKSVQSAMKVGFNKALSAIIDGNITTLIAAAVLYLIGSGTVKGFAQTLALGIIVSMFTALFVTRFVLTSLYTIGFKDEKFYGKTANIKVRNFLSKKNICFIASSFVILVGIVTLAINATSNKGMLNYSLEFKGGTSTNVPFNESRTIEQLEGEVKPVIVEAIGSTDVQLTPVQGSNEVIIKTQELTLEQREKLYSSIEEKFSVAADKITNENISATVSNEMKRDAIVSVIISAVCMLIYIWFRFKDIKFATSAVVALLHDVLVVLTFYAVLRWSVGNTFIACMLTLVGYSINATIVIFDRIRENLKLMKKNDTLVDVVNSSISQTLSRSINTSFTTLIMVVVLYILGVTSVREFALPLIVGIVVGTYSSVCITGALWYVLKIKFAKKEKAA